MDAWKTNARKQARKEKQSDLDVDGIGSSETTGMIRVPVRYMS